MSEQPAVDTVICACCSPDSRPICQCFCHEAKRLQADLVTAQRLWATYKRTSEDLAADLKQCRQQLAAATDQRDRMEEQADVWRKSWFNRLAQLQTQLAAAQEEISRLSKRPLTVAEEEEEK